MASVSITIDQSEIKSLLKKLDKLGDICSPKKELRKTLIRAAKPIVSAIQNAAPVDTGALKESIGIIPYLGSRSGTVFIGVKKTKAHKVITAFYALFLEFGTRHIRRGKFSFFEKSAKSSLPTAEQSIILELKRTIKRLES